MTTAQYVTVVMDRYDGAGNPVVQGSASWAPSMELPDPADRMLIGQGPVPAVFRAGSLPTVWLIANDSIGPQGSSAPGWTWNVTYDGVPGSPAAASYYVVTANGATQYLSELATVPAAQPGQQYLPLTSGPPPTAGEVPVFTGAGYATAPGVSGAVTSVFGRTGAVVAANGDYTAAQVGADVSGAAAAALANAETFATNAVATETTRAETAEALLIPLTQKGAASGVLALGSNSLAVPGQLAPVSPVPGKYAPLLYGAIWGWPFKFYPDAAGCLGDCIAVGDAAMSSGSSLVTCASTAPFKSGDVGVKTAMVQTAAGAYAHIMQLVSSYTSATQVHLAGNATANTLGTPGAIMLYGTDDTANMRTCWAAADAYGLAHGYAEICFDPEAMYALAGQFAVGGGGLGNNILPVPNVSQLVRQYQLYLNGGAEESAGYPNWGQLVPQVGGGATLACLRVDGTNNGTYGPAHIIGGPINGMGGETGASTGWSNVHLVVKGLNTLSPYNATFGGMDLFAIVSQKIHSFSALTASLVPTNGSLPSMASPSNISNQWGWGLRLAAPGNDANVIVDKVLVQGHCYGVGPSEWAKVAKMDAMYCLAGIAPYANGIGAVHLFEIDYAQVENCVNAMAMADLGTIRGRIRHLGTESISAHFYDPSNQMHVDIGLAPQNSEESYKSGGFMSGGTGGTNLGIYNIETRPGPIPSPQAAPATTVAWPNYYYVNLSVELSVSGGTLSALSVTGPEGTVAKVVPSGTTAYAFALPAGCSYTPTYSGTLSHVLTVMASP